MLPGRNDPESEYLDIWWGPVPDTPQEGFIDDDTPDGKLMFMGGQGAGKTMSLVGKCLKLSTINDPIPGIVTVPDFDHFESVILETLRLEDKNGRRWFLEDSQFHYSGHVLEWEGGGPWHVASAVRPNAIKGKNRAWGAMDEPGIQSYQAYRNTIGRIRHVNAKLRQFVATGTPEGLGWMAEQWGEERAANYKVYRMDLRQNVELMKEVPEYLQQVLANSTEQEAASYIAGEMVNLSGALVYITFNRALWREDVPIHPNLPLRITFDFNVDPMSCIIAQIVPGKFGNELNVIDGIIQNNSWTPQVCEEIVRRYGREASARQFGFRGSRGWPGGVVVYGDATGGARSTTSLKSNYDLITEILGSEFPSYKLHETVVRKFNPPELERVNAMNVLMRNALGHTRMFIRRTSPHAKLCTLNKLIRSFEMTIKEAGTNHIAKPAGETHTHPTDALGYLVAAEFPVERPRIVGAGSFGNIDL